MPWWDNPGHLQGQAGRQRREQHEMVRVLGSWSSVCAGACALRELTASGRERGAGVSAAHPAQAWGIGLASKRTCGAESRLRAIGGGRSSASGSNPNDLGPGSLKGKTCNVC